ncbi:hypothetical protein Tco_1561626 [Tanacetum coccineum]
MQETLGTHNDEARSSRSKRSRQHETIEEAMLPRVHHPFRYGKDEEIFSSKAWRRVFDINEPIYIELCHEFYSTYKLDEVCVDVELKIKKVIKFPLCGRAHSLTLLEFARHLGLYHSDEVNEEGFDAYFQGELRGDENFNATDYWLSISTAYHGVFEHMARVYDVPLQGAYNPPGYDHEQYYQQYQQQQQGDDDE